MTSSPRQSVNLPSLLARLFFLSALIAGCASKGCRKDHEKETKPSQSEREPEAEARKPREEEKKPTSKPQSEEKRAPAFDEGGEAGKEKPIGEKAKVAEKENAAGGKGSSEGQSQGAPNGTSENSGAGDDDGFFGGRAGDKQSKAKAAEAAAALKSGRSLLASARKADKNGDPGKAFELATQAWEVASGHPGDVECRALTRQIVGDLERFAARSNRKFSDPTKRRNKPIIEK